jgi:hypothetical protein
MLPPARVVEVLLSARGVDTGRLKMAQGVRTDPDLTPGRGDRQSAYALQRPGFLQAAASFVQDDETPATALPAQAGAGAVGSPKPPLIGRAGQMTCLTCLTTPSASDRRPFH